ncbi:LEPR-XLL domain-containing protein [Roseateles sp. LYH14W]|uniref:LEPR-XLL domain-containing protein n=1 Tax=Pelomonas parva TaxID=3299032 RepID=A0ABW7F1M0_9BURK
MKLRSLLPRRWREAAPSAPLAVKPSARAWHLEALEPRVLLSADPVLGAVLIALPPDTGAAGDADGAYQPEAIDAATLIAQGKSVIGTPGSSDTIRIGNADGSPVIVGGDLTLYADGPGGEILQDGDLFVAGNYTAFGSGHTNVLNGNVTAGGSYTNADSVRISGSLTIESGGSIALGGNNTHYLGGNSSGTTDQLTLKAATNGNINIYSAVDDGSEGGDLLSGLTITQANNVTFHEAVEVNGNLTITAGGIVTFAQGITLGSGGNLTVLGADRVVFNGSVLLQQGGSILLEADSIDMLSGALGSGAIAGTGTVTLRPSTLSTPMDLFYLPGVPTAGALQLTAAEMKAFGSGFTQYTFGWSASGHAVAGSGDVRVGTAEDVGPVVGGSLTVFGNHITAVNAEDSPERGLKLGPAKSLVLDARANITLNNFTEVDTVTMTSATGLIQQVDLQPGDGVSEPLRALSLTATAVTGVNLPNLEVNQLDVVNSGQGNIVLSENAARSTSRFSDTAIDGSVTVLRLAQTGLTGTNGISLTSQAGVSSNDGSARPGNITLAAGAGISLATSGALSISALGTGSDISLLAPIAVQGGAVTLSAADAFSASVAAPITASGPSAVAISSGTGSLTLAANVTTVGGSLTLSGGAALDLSGITLNAGPSGAIALQSVGDLKVGIINAASSITLSSTGGAILDALAGDAANLVGEAAIVSLTALNGVGTGSAPLRTAIGSLTATVSGTTGGIFIAEETALTVTSSGLTTAGSGAVVVRNAASDLTVQGPVHANGTGHILLESMAFNLYVQSDVLAQGGSISLLAAGAVAATGTEVRTRSAGQTLDLRAGTSLSAGAATVLATAGGHLRLQAPFVTLSSVDAGTGTVAVVATQDVAATTGTTLTAGAARLQAGGSIGTGGVPLALHVAQLAASAGGAMVLNETDDISVGSVADPAVNRVGALGTVTALTPSSALAGLSNSNGVIVLTAGGAVSLDSAVNATSIAGSHVRVGAGGALAVNAAVASTGGLVTLQAGGAITHAATGSVTTAAQVIDEQAGGAITLAAGTTVNTAGGRLRMEAGGVLTLGQLSAGNAEAWLQGTHIVSAAGNGIDLVASDARLISTGTGTSDGIGSAANAVSLQVQRLAAQSAGAGGVFISEADAVIVDAIAASSFTRVQADGTLAMRPAEAELRGISSAAGLVMSAGGNLVVGVAVTAQRMHLSAGNDLVVGLLSGGLTSGGVITLAAARDLHVQDNVNAAAGLDLSAGRDLLMNPGVSATAQGAALLQAVRDVRVGVVDVGSTKSLTINAGGSLTDADAAGDSSVNLKAGKLVLIATAGIGQAGNAVETAADYLGASAGGGVFIDETDGLAINGALGTNFGTVQRVGADGSVSTLTATEVQGLSSGNSPLVLRLLGGALTVDAAVQSQGGAIRLDATGAVTLNAAVASNGGALSLLAGGAVTQAAAGSVRSSGGAIDAQAGGAWTQAQGSRVASGGGALRLAATGALALAELDAGSGAMSVTASQVKDLAGDGATTADLTAASLVLRTTGTAATDGVGSGADALDIAVQSLGVATAGGGIYLSQVSGALVVDSLPAFSGSRVQTDGTVATAAVTDAALAGLSSSDSLVLAGGGNLSFNAASGATGSVLVTSAGDLTVGAVLSGLIVSLNAGNDLLLNANLSSTGSTRSLDLQAVRDLTQAQGTSLQTANGVIALQAGRDITLEALNAGTAGAALIAGGAIVDGDTAGDTETDITASALRLTAGGAAGTAANALETAVTSLSASAALLSLVQTQALTIDRVATSLQRVSSTGSLSAVDLGAQEDLLTANGTLLLTVNSGDLTINGGTASTEQAVNAGGSLLLRAVSGSVAVKAGITAAGDASLRAGGELNFTAGGDVTLAGAGSLDAEAGAGLTMADGSVFTSGTGSLRLSAVLNLSVGALQTGGDVSLLARSITDAGGTETDVTARALRVLTTGTGTTQGFGTGAAPLQLQVATLAASIAGTGAGGFFASEADALAVDAVAVAVSRVAADGTQSAVADAALSDLVSGGNVVLVLGGAGTLALNDGGNADGLALQSGGNVLLDVGGDLGVLAALRSSSGAISLLAGASITVAADVAITRTGRTLDVQAGGAVTMTAAANLAVIDSAIRVQAGGDLTVGGIAAGLGQISLISTGGSILAAAGHSGSEASAAQLRLSAAVGIGTGSDRLDIAVQRVSARAAGGGIWLQEADAIIIGDTAASVRRVSALATTTATIDDATQSDLVTTGGNGSIALATTNGSINFVDGTAPADGGSVTAHGTGSVALKAGGAAAVVNLPAGSIEQQGPVSIDSGLKFDGAVTITGGQGGGRGDGPVTIGGAIDGTAGGAADQLVVTSDGADVVFGGAIGATERLGGLAINDARNVRFDADVKLAGDLTLQASGKVEFKGGLDLSSGSLSIVGATELVIGNVVITSGNAVIRVDALTLSGLISGSAAARLELAGAAGGVSVGGTGMGLALSAAQLGAMQGFGQVLIGRSDQGATAVDVATLGTLATPHLTLAGASLDLQGGSTGLNAAVTLLDLSAGQDLALAGRLALAAAGADMRATAGGALRMATDGVLATQAGEVRLQAAGDLRIGQIDTRASGGGAMAAVVLASTMGTISEANADAAADVFADVLTLRGRGPALSGGASEAPAALDVQADKLDVDAPRGVVLRDSASNGRTAFNLLDGDQLYQQLVALGSPSRQASVAAVPDQPSAATADAWGWLNALKTLQESRDTTLAVGGSGPTMSALLAAPVRGEASAVFAADSAPLLASQLAALLSLDVSPVVVEPVADGARFRVWSEELVV